MTSPNVLTYVSDVGTYSALSPGGLGCIARAGGPWESELPEQAIGFLRHGAARVAYAVTGSGPPLLLDVGRAHHLEAFWRHPPYRELVQRLSRHFSVVRWDRPGFGLSDRRPVDLSPDGEMALLERLVGFVASGPVSVLAADDAAPHHVRFAARHPGSITRLALFGTAAEGRRLTRSLSPSTLRVLAAAPSPALHEVLAAATASGCDSDLGSWLASALEASAGVSDLVELV